jgi:acyl-[acyl-carrier-protein]-phospholipid O-acyltransferase / long-chain-fatty-acid--[acyl-carrier-protein] ligase
VETGTYRGLLKSRGFQSFLWTQFLGALNDNIYILAFSLLAVDMAAGRGGDYLAIALAVFNAPFFLFSGYAGHLADAFSKRSVLIWTKSFEVLAMAGACLALLSHRVDLMIGMLFLMGAKSAFFSPAKYGIVPEMLPDRDLSRANGLLEMTTFVAIIAGTSAGAWMVQSWKGQPWKTGLLLMVLALAGTLVSFGIPRVSVSGSSRRFQWNPWGEIGEGFRTLHGNPRLWLTVLAISYFWLLGAVLKMDLILFGKDILLTDNRWTGMLYTFMAIGIGAGSLTAGRLSGDKIELGLVPLGSLGIGIFGIMLGLSGASYAKAATLLALLGFAGGLFIVPLNAFLQQRSGAREKGRLIATNNLMNTGAMLIAAGVFWIFTGPLRMRADNILIVAALFTSVATVYAAVVVPEFLVRFVLVTLTHTLYRIRVLGQEHVPVRGPALLVSNHMSHVDALLVGSTMQRFVRYLMYRPYYELPAFHWLARLMHAIPIAERPPRQAVEALRRARDELRAGHIVCIFAEGAISRTGNMLPFKAGFERIVKGLDVPVIPVQLDRLWGSIFSFKDGRFFWKWPERIPYPVTVSFGRPLPSSAAAQEVRTAVMELGAAAVHYRRTSRDLLHLRFIRSAKRRWFSFAMADSTGRQLTFGQVLVGSMLLSRRIQRRCSGEAMIGLLLPASVAGALANVATLMAGKIPINLNFTLGREAMKSAVEQCEIRTLLTSRAFLARIKLEPGDSMVFLEDLLKTVSRFEKLRTAVSALLCPRGLFCRVYNPGRRDPDYLATVIFSSGSTGTPKGVMLSHHGIISNLEALGQLLWLTPQDRIMGVLPFFHSFGFTCTIWFPLIAGAGVVYHPNPMDAQGIGKLVAKYKATFLLSTPTFCSTYAKKCSAEEFASLRFVMVGAEKLRESVARAFSEKFGLSLCEGYGCTEMAPVVSGNILNRGWHSVPAGRKPGTVGQPLPGVVAKVVDLLTGEALPSGMQGLLMVKGPNRMIGYLGQPERSVEAFQEGWYNTGDIASIDEDGFITITDRLSRFSKIAGEMVPHIKIEETVNEILGDYAAVVTALADEHRGERLVVLYARKDIAPSELWELVSESSLPKIWIPKPENFYQVEALPMLPTGKLDLSGAKAWAAKMAAQSLR